MRVHQGPTKRLLRNVHCKTRYLRDRADVYAMRYSNGRIALQLFQSTNGEPLMTCTVNLPEHPCGEFEVYVKDYSENEGCEDFLREQHVIEQKPVSSAISGYAILNRYRLTEEIIAMLDNTQEKQA